MIFTLWLFTGIIISCPHSNSGKSIRTMTPHSPHPDQEKHDGLLVLEPKTSSQTKRPPLYKVILLNDDYTPMDFVIYLLQSVFHKAEEEAVAIMLEIHTKGSGHCGTYTRDVAETKIHEVTTLARQHEHPLQCVMEKE